MKTVSMRGKTVDFGKMIAADPTKKALGNANMNARGDIINPRTGHVVKTREEIVAEYHQNKSAVRNVSIKNLKDELYPTSPAQTAPDAPVTSPVAQTETVTPVASPVPGLPGRAELEQLRARMEQAAPVEANTAPPPSGPGRAELEQLRAKMMGTAVKETPSKQRKLIEDTDSNI